MSSKINRGGMHVLSMLNSNSFILEEQSSEESVQINGIFTCK